MAPFPLGIMALAGAGGGALPAFDLLETTTLTSSASSVTFSGLGAYSDYKHLQIRSITQQTGTSGYAPYAIRFNGDTGTNYVYHEMRGNGNGMQPDASTNDDLIRFTYGSQSQILANAFAPQIWDLLDFSSSSKNKTTRGFSVRDMNDPNNTVIALGSGLWRNTDPVTSINIFPQSTNWAAKSRFSLYGVK
jgi:hypothetical protein